MVKEKGKPIFPPALKLTPAVAKALDINPATIVKVDVPKNLRPLPPQIGTLGYDFERMEKVLSRFPGQVVELPDVPTAQRLTMQASGPRPYTVGDLVKEGDVLAVVWSQALGDKKGNFIDALIDLKRDTAYYKDVKKLYDEQGAVAKSTVFDAERIRDKDISAVNSAERALRTWKLTDEEIESLRKEADTIAATKRDPAKEKEWARVEVKAWKGGIIVEKNTHLGDWVDPSYANTPMYRIADLSKLMVWIHPSEEYLPVLQNYLNKPGANPLKWDIMLQADPKGPPLDGTLVRIGPSLDPNDHRPLLVGLVNNPAGKLLVGQFITATIYVPVEKGLVEIPTNALNEEQGQSIVFVQRDPKNHPLEFQIKAVSVVYRFKDVVYVRSELPEENAKTTNPGPLPIQALEPGEYVLTESVVELTRALSDLQAKGEAGQPE